MSKILLAELILLSIPKILEQFDELSADELRELEALENARDTPRVTLLEHIQEKLAEVDKNANGDGQAPKPPTDANAITQSPTRAPGSPAADAPQESPPWQREDYLGPLTMEQAEWRNRNLYGRHTP